MRYHWHGPDGPFSDPPQTAAEASLQQELAYLQERIRVIRAKRAQEMHEDQLRQKIAMARKELAELEEGK